MSKEKETDAATALSQMSQLVGVPFDLSPGLSTTEQDGILEADTIGATCTLQPSSLESDMLFSLPDDHSFSTNRNVTSDAYITFDGAEHPYAANTTDSNNMLSKLKFRDPETLNSSVHKCGILFALPEERTFSSNRMTSDAYITFDGAEHPYAANTSETNKLRDVETLRSTSISRWKKAHSCETCMRTFTTKSDLKRHMKVHEKLTGQKYKCGLCSKEFRDQATKTRHLKIHDDKCVFKCDQCSKQFTRCDSYKNHLSTHSNNKRFKCSFCRSEFNYKSSFNRHLTVHKSENLFMCEICGKAFRRSDYVDTHRKQVHDYTSPSHERSSGVKRLSLSKSEPKLKKIEDNKNRQTKVVRKKRNIKHTTMPSIDKNHLSRDLNTFETDCFEIGSRSNINAVPILMSMAENAANSVLKKPNKRIHEEGCNNYSHSELITDVSIPLPSPQIDGDFISLLDESSNDEISDCDSIASNDLHICLNENSKESEDSVNRISCIVSNPLNDSK